MKKRSWSPEQRAKFKKSMRKRRLKFYKSGAMGKKPDPVRGRDRDATRDAIVFLRHMRKSVVDRIRDGSLSEPDPAHLYGLQALNILEGK